MTRRHVRARPAPVAPPEPVCPVDPERTALYSPEELYGDRAYAHSLDARAYAWSREPRDHEKARQRALHDFAIDEALDGWIAGRHIVGVMGGHDLRRGSAGYAAAARLGHQLGHDRVVATGGGPGAMEAANLGAWLAHRDWSEVEGALGELAGDPTFTPSIDAWAQPALRIREESLTTRPHGRSTSLGVPTWFYGHEPPNVFCDAIAKYFRNATREAILLQICDAGIVFLPGAAGTVQEVFQDACENYYASPGMAAPMVLVGRTYWTETFPAWPLLRSLAATSGFADLVHLVDDPGEAAAFLAG